LLGVLILLAVAPSNATMPLLQLRSAAPLADFKTCFAQAQERSGAAWAYLPAGQGGTFTDSGAHGAPASYWLHVRASGATTHMRLFSAASGSAPSSVTQGVEQCR
jgi:hypothetical protein